MNAIEELDANITTLRQQVADAAAIGNPLTIEELTHLLKTAEGRRRHLRQFARRKR
jgi:hypothetical protein